MDKTEAVRVQKSLLAGLEKRFLIWIAARLPVWVNPDRLTATGLVGAFVAGGGYVLSNWGKGFLWLSSAGFVINWLGDSLDGTLARVRKIQRPAYGFFIDHNADAITALVIAVGAGISPYISFAVVMLVLASYYLLSIFTYINTYLKDSFVISYSGFGPTELRLAIITINTLIFFLPHANTILELWGLSLNLYDFFALAVALVLVSFYFLYFFQGKKKYERTDPPRS